MNLIVFEVDDWNIFFIFIRQEVEIDKRDGKRS